MDGLQVSPRHLGRTSGVVHSQKNGAWWGTTHVWTQAGPALHGKPELPARSIGLPWQHCSAAAAATPQIKGTGRFERGVYLGATGVTGGV